MFLIYLFMLCVYVSYIYIYIEICAPTCRLLDFYIMGLWMGLRYEVQDCRLPKDSRGPQQHAPLPCRRRGPETETSQVGARMGVLLWSKRYWFHGYLVGGFKHFFIFTPNPGEMIQFD